MVNVLLFLYHFAWTFLVIISLPLIHLIKNPRLLERLALNLPPIPTKNKSIWIHALSVGEVISAIPLVRSLRREYPSRDIVFTVNTAQGIKIAQDELKGEVELLITMPLDFWWSVHRIVNHINPSIFLLIETDIWPGLIAYLKRRGIKTVLLNGRVSPRTFLSYKRFRCFSRRILNAMEVCLMQSELDRERLLQIGVQPSKVKSVGNIKYDREWVSMDEKEHDYWLNQLNIKSENRVWVAGSTHEGEDELILEVFKRLNHHFPLLRLIVAPRKIERSGHILRLSRIQGLKAMLRTHLHEDSHPFEVLILDTIGDLERIYGIAEISFVGGSLIPIGGHNLLEPASFGCPVLFGPHTHNFLLMSELLIEAGGGKRVKNVEDLFEIMKWLLSDPEEAAIMGTRAKKVVEANRGALKRVMGYVRIIT